MLLSVKAVRKQLLTYVGLGAKDFTKERAEEEVRAHYGSPSLDLAEIWFDLCHFDRLTASTASGVPRNISVCSLRREIAISSGCQ